MGGGTKITDRKTFGAMIKASRGPVSYAREKRNEEKELDKFERNQAAVEERKKKKSMLDSGGDKMGVM
jgi:Zn-finger nucleic acid-binding protein